MKKCEPLRDAIIRARLLGLVAPLVERVMGAGRRARGMEPEPVAVTAP